jgi:hypothetical protein
MLSHDYHYELHQERAADLRREAEHARLATAAGSRAKAPRGRLPRRTGWMARWSARRAAGRAVGESSQPEVSPEPAQPISTAAGGTPHGSGAGAPEASIPGQRRATSTRR